MVLVKASRQLRWSSGSYPGNGNGCCDEKLPGGHAIVVVVMDVVRVIMDNVGLLWQVAIIRLTDSNLILSALPTGLLRSLLALLHTVGHHIVDDADEAATTHNAANNDSNVGAASRVIAAITVAVTIATLA